jgi:membrane-bound lytic murein transglycosylase B
VKTGIVVMLLSVPLLGAVGTAATVAVGVPSQPANASALADIPPAYLVLYQEAGQQFGVPWQVLAAIGRVESDHGRNPNAYRPNYAGAVGPMQFLPSTFAEYAWAAGHLGADILEPHDAIFAAAAMLKNHGAPADLRGAIYAYNHAGWYVDLVLSWAARYGWQP